MSNTFGMALMAYWNVGLNVNTLPVISLGIGFGEDYGIYIVSRAIEEYQRQDRSDLNQRADRRCGDGRQSRALHGFSDLGQHRLLGVFAAALSSRDGHPVADHSDDEYARRFVALACADRLAETEICHGISEVMRIRSVSRNFRPGMSPLGLILGVLINCMAVRRGDQDSSRPTRPSDDVRAALFRR